MLKQLAAVAALGVLAATAWPAGRLVAPTPADGHTIHVLAPHVINGHVQGPYHHYCKVISPEPVIECLIYVSTDSMARLTQVEYIVAKSITRTGEGSGGPRGHDGRDHLSPLA